MAQLIIARHATLFWASVFKARPNKMDPSKPDSYSVSVCYDVSDPTAFELREQIEKLLIETYGNLNRIADNGYPFSMQTTGQGADQKETGLVQFRMSCPAWDREGSPRNAPTVIDSLKNPWPPQHLLGNGTKANVAFRAWTWENKFKQVGCSLELKAVQVLEHQAYSTDGVDLFEPVQGAAVAPAVAPPVAEPPAPAPAPAAAPARAPGGWGGRHDHAAAPATRPANAWGRSQAPGPDEEIPF